METMSVSKVKYLVLLEKWISNKLNAEALLVFSYGLLINHFLAADNETRMYTIVMALVVTVSYIGIHKSKHQETRNDHLVKSQLHNLNGQMKKINEAFNHVEQENRRLKDQLKVLEAERRLKEDMKRGVKK